MDDLLNLKTYFGEDLHEYPENPEDIKKFIEIELQKINELDVEDQFKKLSQLAVYYKLLKNYTQAHELLSQASDYYGKNNLKLAMINDLRWADVFRYEKRFEEARKILLMVEKSISINLFFDYEDFYFQHLGKLFFDQNDFKNAYAYFEKALKLRLKKNIPELISSTEWALKITEQKMEKFK